MNEELKELLKKTKENYYNKINNEENFKNFLEIYEKTEDKDAEYHLAKCYLMGVGTEKNLKKAFEHIKKLAELEFEKAYFLLGYMYFHGEGTKMNDIAAEKWLLKAIECNNQYTSSAKFILGLIYCEGEDNGVLIKKILSMD